MSVVEEFEELQQRIVQRLEELQPLVTEYENLLTVAERLGLGADGGRIVLNAAVTAGSPSRHGSAGKADPRSRPPRRRARRRPSAAPGEREAQVLTAVTTRSPITVPEIAADLGVDPTSLYRSVRRLLAAGRIRKDGTALSLPPRDDS